MLAEVLNQRDVVDDRDLMVSIWWRTEHSLPKACKGSTLAHNPLLRVHYHP